jgi:hypothetical protein
MRRARILLLAVAPHLLYLFSCATSSKAILAELSPDAWDIDPQRCLSLKLRQDTEIQSEVIRAQDAASARLSWYVVKYVEQENRKGFIPQSAADYVNTFLVNVVETQGGGIRVTSRYLVVDMWRYLPERGIKTCHQWTLWDDDLDEKPDRVDFQFFIEDFENHFLEEHRRAIDPMTMKKFTGFYHEVVEFFSGRVEGAPTPWPASIPDPVPLPRVGGEASRTGRASRPHRPLVVACPASGRLLRLSRSGGDLLLSTKAGASGMMEPESQRWPGGVAWSAKP